jgi:similar to spore coat protein
MSTVMSAVGEATGLKPNDQVITQALLAGAKIKVMAYAGALVEAATPEVRHMLQEHLQAALAGHERMIKLAMNRGWYKADASPEQLLQQAIQQAQPVIQ